MAQRPEFQKIEREPMSNRARGQLRDALFAGRFEPGSSLPLRQLAEMFGTSITPVRDAVNQLVAQGVLEQGARNSACVPDIGPEVLQHLTIVRCELEGRATREAAQKADRVAVESLENQLGRMRALIARRDLATYLDAHRSFHFQIYEMAGIPPLKDMIENLWLRCGPVLSLVIPDYVQSLKGTDHHVAILEAIRSGSGQNAEAEVVADIEEAASYLLGLTGRDGRIRRAAAVPVTLE